MQWAARCSVVLASLYKAMPLSLMVCSLRATTQTEVGMTKKCGCKVDDLGHCRNWWPDAAPRSPSSKLTVWSATAVCAGLKHIVVWCRSSAGWPLRRRAVHGPDDDAHAAASRYSERWWRSSCMGHAVGGPVQCFDGFPVEGYASEPDGVLLACHRRVRSLHYQKVWFRS